jgi:hypothetical protein
MSLPVTRGAVGATMAQEDEGPSDSHRWEGLNHSQSFDSAPHSSLLGDAEEAPSSGYGVANKD